MPRHYTTPSSNGTITSNGDTKKVVNRLSVTPQPSDENDQKVIEIEITTEEHKVNNKAVEALATDDTVFQREGALVQVIRIEESNAGGLERPVGSPVIAKIPQSIIRERLTACAQFKKGGVAVHPPEWCVKAVAERGQWPGIRHLDGITECPVLRADGTILDQPGYDPATRLVYTGRIAPIVPQAPTEDDLRAAVQLLLGLVKDFPFASKAHKAAWLAFLLTPLARYAFDGPAPLTLIDSNTPGSGKGLLVALVSIITTGMDTPVSASHSDDTEMRKSITSAALAGDALIVIYNVVGCLAGAALEAAITSTRWRDRILGGNTRVDLPLNATWAATGNNVHVGRDMSRRVLHVRLESGDENPEDRTNFAIPNLKVYADEHRAELLGAALTILRANCVAGRPAQHLKPWGSFEAWTALVRSAIAWVGQIRKDTPWNGRYGLPDPGETRQGVREQCDPESEALPGLLAGIAALDKRGTGVTVAEIIAKSLYAAKGPIKELFDALAVLVPPKGGETSPKSLGMRLHHIRGRVIGGLTLERVGKDNGSARWRVTGTTGTTGTTSNSAGENKKEKSVGGGAGNSPRSPSSPRLSIEGGAA